MASYILTPEIKEDLESCLFPVELLICSRCGRFVKNIDAEFYFNEQTYQLCGTCFPFAFSCFINGDILGLITFENWDFNTYRQKNLSVRLISDILSTIF